MKLAVGISPCSKDVTAVQIQVVYSFSEPFYKITVPTVDTVRYDFLVYNLIKAHRPVLLTGPVGTGKTSVAQGVLSRLDPKTYSILTVNMSAQVWYRLIVDYTGRD